jgi:hypothetical protein
MSQGVIFPYETYQALLQGSSTFLHTWVCSLPTQPCVLKTPQLVKMLCGLEQTEIVSHDLLLFYRCTLWYLPEQIEKLLCEAEILDGTFDLKETIQQIMIGIQYHQRKLYEQECDVDAISFLNIYEDAIFKCIHLLQLASNSESRADLVRILPAIMTMNDKTRESLGLSVLATHKEDFVHPIPETQVKSIEAYKNDREHISVVLESTKDIGKD